MRRTFKTVIVCLTFVALGASLRAQPLWQVDSASITFEIKNAGLPVHGSFAGLEADVRFDPDHLERSVIVASIDCSTVNSGIELRNRHLRKHDYFDVDHYPRIRMEAVHMEKNEPGKFSGTFVLELKGIRKEISMPFTLSRRAQSATLAGAFTINRLDYAIGEPSVILADEVVVHVSLEISPAE